MRTTLLLLLLLLGVCLPVAHGFFFWEDYEDPNTSKSPDLPSHHQSQDSEPKPKIKHSSADPKPTHNQNHKHHPDEHTQVQDPNHNHDHGLHRKHDHKPKQTHNHNPSHRLIQNDTQDQSHEHNPDQDHTHSTYMSHQSLNHVFTDPNHTHDHRPHDPRSHDPIPHDPIPYDPRPPHMHLNPPKRKYPNKGHTEGDIHTNPEHVYFTRPNKHYYNYAYDKNHDYAHNHDYQLTHNHNHGGFQPTHDHNPQYGHNHYYNFHQKYNPHHNNHDHDPNTHYNHHNPHHNLPDDYHNHDYHHNPQYGPHYNLYDHNPHYGPHHNPQYSTYHDYNHNHNTDDSHNHKYNQAAPRHKQKNPCPMLYTPVGGYCIAFFSVAKMTWSSAKEFCQSIFGDLLTFTSVNQYFDLVTYLQSTDMEVELWVGGRREKVAVEGHIQEEKNVLLQVGRPEGKVEWRWKWTDGSDMPMGTPYWAQRQSRSTTRYYNPAPRIQAPEDVPFHHANQHWCAAMDSTNFYYLNDEDCSNKKSPVCVLKKDVNLVMVKGSELSYPAFETQDSTSTPQSTVGITATTPIPPRATTAPSVVKGEDSSEETKGSSEETKGSSEEVEDTSGKVEGSGEAQDRNEITEGSGIDDYNWLLMDDLFIDSE